MFHVSQTNLRAFGRPPSLAQTRAVSLNLVRSLALRMTFLDCISSLGALWEEQPREALLHTKHPLSVHSATRMAAFACVSTTPETTF